MKERREKAKTRESGERKEMQRCVIMAVLLHILESFVLCTGQPY